MAGTHLMATGHEDLDQLSAMNPSAPVTKAVAPLSPAMKAVCSASEVATTDNTRTGLVRCPYEAWR
jgi:hypothetical protein